MNETRDESGCTGQQGYPRRRFLAGLLAWVWGALVAGAWGVAPKADLHPELGATGPRELPLKEADYYRPHDLAG
jgi:hypothetical protein